MTNVAVFVLIAIVGYVTVATDRPVRVASGNGVVLAGRGFDPGQPGPGALFFHMCREDAVGAWSGVAERVARAGVHALTINYRGWGGSTGRPFPAPPSLDEARKYWRDNWTEDADRALEQLLSQMGRRGPVAVIGSSCGVYMSLLTASRHRETVRAVVALAGPHGPEHVAYLKGAPGVAVLSGSSEADGPAPEWARELMAATAHPASQFLLLKEPAHGTDLFVRRPGLQDTIANWIVERLSGNANPLKD